MYFILNFQRDFYFWKILELLLFILNRNPVISTSANFSCFTITGYRCIGCADRRRTFFQMFPDIIIPVNLLYCI